MKPAASPVGCPAVRSAAEHSGKCNGVGVNLDRGGFPGGLYQMVKGAME